MASFQSFQSSNVLCSDFHQLSLSLVFPVSSHLKPGLNKESSEFVAASSRWDVGEMGTAGLNAAPSGCVVRKGQT